MPAEVLLALTTLDSAAAAHQLAHQLVETRLAACVHIESLESVYRWDGQVRLSPEWRLLIKTTSERWAALRAFIDTHHPYEVPALVAWPCSQTPPQFAEWVRQETHPAPGGL
ncbi:divalent-cation tolerance protein CutA [Inhella gelatinilytica]|uniref:Divalent-cation tolerance protein CutA n=1 Tax=Inhella gelatinilytica TaxID=2795030 RepID=A0A931NFJ8_9BURK|nr:divalent-cation tolerance protein CutA [Inhella gelatinilytica]MBH9553626.1 divalent-cation tolerance protein CutA [Inhella gelatinilytica]